MYRHAPPPRSAPLCTGSVAGKQTQESIPMSGTRGLPSNTELKMHCLVYGRGVRKGEERRPLIKIARPGQLDTRLGFLFGVDTATSSQIGVATAPSGSRWDSMEVISINRVGHYWRDLPVSKVAETEMKCKFLPRDYFSELPASVGSHILEGYTTCMHSCIPDYTDGAPR